jgi:hypothetical protein
MELSSYLTTRNYSTEYSYIFWLSKYIYDLLYLLRLSVMTISGAELTSSQERSSKRRRLVITNHSPKTAAALGDRFRRRTRIWAYVCVVNRHLQSSTNAYSPNWVRPRRLDCGLAQTLPEASLQGVKAAPAGISRPRLPPRPF